MSSGEHEKIQEMRWFQKMLEKDAAFPISLSDKELETIENALFRLGERWNNDFTNNLRLKVRDFRVENFYMEEKSKDA